MSEQDLHRQSCDGASIAGLTSTPQEALQRSEQRYRLLTETTGDWVWEIDATGRYTYSSPRIRDLLGYEPREVLGRTPFEFMPPDEAERVGKIFDRIASRRVPFVALENTLLHKSGGRVVVETTGAPFFASDGEFLGYQGCDRDVTERKKADQALREYSAALEAANQRLEAAYEETKAAMAAKSLCLANVSHEIRTPMTAILGFTDLLLANASSPEEIEALQTIKRNGIRLLDLINDILDLSKIDTGKLEIQRSSCSPRAILSDVISLMHVRASAKNLSLEMECCGPTPEIIQTDPLRLRQILINLIGNAIQFTQQGGVRVRASFVQDEADRPMMQFEVIDTGAGFSEEQLSRLFHPFAQVDSTSIHQPGASGLGLVIIARLAELLDGKLTVESQPGKGSTFRLTVAAGETCMTTAPQPQPQACVRDNGERPVAEMPAGGIATLPYHLLLAEDGPDNQRLVSFLLRRAGAQVELAENGRIALDLVRAARDRGEPFDLILMDMQMPVMDGYEATRQLRNEGFALPIVALTAHAMAGDREKCLEAGCDDYISKPVDRQTLIENIARRLALPTQAPSSAAS